MKNQTKALFLSNAQHHSTSQNIGFLLLRFFVGLALCTVFEKFLPHNGIWGPQEWFIQDTANMGFPFPTFFAWLAVLSEFFGGILLMLGLFTRSAALLNFFVTFTATFIYHQGDIGDSGLLSFFFMIMCFCIFLFGPGKFSLDYFMNKNFTKKSAHTTMIILLLLSFNHEDSQANHSPKSRLMTDTTQVQFYLKNNSILPQKITFIIYQPQQQGNNTRVKWFLPFQRMKFNLPAKSKIYIATKSQIDVVMQGKRIDDEQPFISVNKAMSDTTLKLNK